MHATRLLATLVAFGLSTLALAGRGGQPAPRFHLPLSILAPGPHLLTIEAKAEGRSIRRDVRFVRTSSR